MELLQCVQFSRYFSFNIQPTNIIFQKRNNTDTPFWKIKIDLNDHYSNKYICVRRPKLLLLLQNTHQKVDEHQMNNW